MNRRAFLLAHLALVAARQAAARTTAARPFRDGLAYVTPGRAGGYIRPDGEFV